MNWLDVVAVAGLAGFMLRGVIKGLVVESLGFLGLLLAAAVGLAIHPVAAEPLRRLLGASSSIAVLVAAILVFLVVEFFWLMAMYFLVGRGRREGFHRSGANRMGGALFAGGKGALLLSLLLLVLEVAPMPGAYRAAAEDGVVAGRLRAVAPSLGGHIAGFLPRLARQRYEAFRDRVAQLGARWRIIAPVSTAPASPAGSDVSSSPRPPGAEARGKAPPPRAKP